MRTHGIFLHSKVNKNALKPKIKNRRRIITTLFLSLLLLQTFAFTAGNFASAAGPSTVLLGTASGFSVLAGSGITNTGPTTIYGDVGTYPTPSETGFGSVTIVGTNHGADAVTQQAKTDLLTAYNDAAGRTPVTTIPTELGGSTLIPGVYNSAAGTFGITGTVTLDGEGDPNAVFIFQMESTLITASSSVVSLINGARACNVFWQVGSSATIGTSSSFVGTIMALTSITLTTGATVDGRVLALNGAVTMDTNTIGQTIHLEGITLTPATATNPVGTNHMVTATVAGTGDPVPNRNVNFTVISGPNAGLTGSAITDSNGQATFTYLGNIAGIDTIQASFQNSQGAIVTSAPVTKNWTFSGPAISVVKQISADNSTWVDADLPPGLLVTVGSNVYYKFVVTNIGNEILENITLTDNTYTLTGLIVPPALAPGESFTYYLGPILAELGQHTNIATATAQFDNTDYTNSNNANYNGTPSEIPSISVVKEISIDNSTWVDANVLPGISVIVGTNIYYRFNVTNTGNVPLSNLTLTDNTYTLIGLVIPPTLAPDASFVYYLGPVQAQVGQHTNTATATGQYNNIVYSDTDNANYIASPTPGPSIIVIKWVSSDNITWVDANSPPGLNVTAGSYIYFKFEVTNTGNVTLSCITLKDSCYKLCNLKLPSTLAPNVTFTYYLGPIQAQAGQHTDIATATGKYYCKVYCDTDNATYTGTPKPKPCPSIMVVKWVSSDNITWYDANTPPGITVAAGSNVYFKFEITNTGNVALSCITLKDSCYKLCNIGLPSTLAPKATFTYYLGPIQAQAGQHTDTATATGKYNCKVYCDTDDANYNGELPKPCIPKYVPIACYRWYDAIFKWMNYPSFCSRPW
jgi:hypothetical protein